MRNKTCAHACMTQSHIQSIQSLRQGRLVPPKTSFGHHCDMLQSKAWYHQCPVRIAQSCLADNQKIVQITIAVRKCQPFTIHISKSPYFHCQKPFLQFHRHSGDVWEVLNDAVIQKKVVVVPSPPPPPPPAVIQKKVIELQQQQQQQQDIQVQQQQVPIQQKQSYVVNGHKKSVPGPTPKPPVPVTPVTPTPVTPVCPTPTFLFRSELSLYLCKTWEKQSTTLFES